MRSKRRYTTGSGGRDIACLFYGLFVLGKINLNMISQVVVIGIILRWNISE